MIDISKFLQSTEKQFRKKFSDSETEFSLAKDLKPATGLIVDNPLFEFILDRRFLAYGRFYLAYGKKGSSKTSIFFDLAKLFQRNKGIVIWLETEHADDRDYAAKQGVDMDNLIVQHPKSLEEGLSLAEMYIRNLPKEDPDGTTPVLICFDSLAGATSEYEMDQSHSIYDMMPGTHARMLSRFYSEMAVPLGMENCVFLALNQLKEKIGGMGWSEESKESMKGGNAPLFSSTYQWKMADAGDYVAPDENGVERKVGSKHKISCVRNKLGREGKGQDVEFDLYIKGGIDWFTPLVRKLGDYSNIVQKSGGYYYWKLANTEYVHFGEEGQKENRVIDTEQAYRDLEMARMIAASPAAKEVIRKAFGIPDLPTSDEVKVIETERLTKRKKKAKSLADDPPRTQSTPV